MHKSEGSPRSMAKMTVLYGLALALGAFVSQWFEYQYALRLFSTEIYIVLLAIMFTGIGLWIGARLGHRARHLEFERNLRVIRTLRLTDREIQVLERVAEGDSNHEIAKRLFVSTSTIKTHLVHLYQKLDVSRRTQAVQKAKILQIIP